MSRICSCSTVSRSFFIFVSHVLLVMNATLLTKAVVVNMLLYLYAVNSEPSGIKLDPEHGNENGHARQTHELVRDTEEFELEGLTSEDEDAADSEPLVKKERRGE
jgi:hypothetical protein